MPRLVGPLGRSWAVGTDDFSFLCPCSALLHGLWGLCASSQLLRAAAWRAGAPAELCDANAVACFAAASLDIVMGFYACRGAILDADRRAHLPVLLALRVWLGAVLCAIAASAVLLLFLAPPGEPVVGDAPEGGWDIPGFLAWALPAALPPAAVAVLLASQLVWHSIVSAIGVLISRPIGKDGRTVDAPVGTVLRWFGASDESVNMIAGALMELLVDVDVVPSDVVFGLLLVGLRQQHPHSGGRGIASALNVDAEDIEDLEAPMVAEAPPDEAVLRDLVRLSAFANGMYGSMLGMIGEAAYDGTSLVPPHRLAAACCRSMPCRQHPLCGGSPPWRASNWCRCFPPRAPVEGDNCLRSNSYALRRAVEGVAPGAAPELLWGTWARRDSESAPPFAVIADHAAREVVIAIRGTFSIKDCIIDVCVRPEHVAPPCLPRCAKLGAEDGPFLAHAGMLASMRDVLARLEENGVLRDALAPGGKACGYNLVCTGHSLGAGIAVLLALELRGTWGEAVRFVGFETPGCTVSPALAREIERLGWVSIVCAQDWAPRASLRSFQLLRERVLDELTDCPLSKAQILLHLSERSLRQLVRYSCSFLIGLRLCFACCGRLRQRLFGTGAASST